MMIDEHKIEQYEYKYHMTAHDLWSMNANERRTRSLDSASIYLLAQAAETTRRVTNDAVKHTALYNICRELAHIPRAHNIFFLGAHELISHVWHK